MSYFRVLVLSLLSFFVYSSPCLAGEDYQTMEERVPVDLSEYRIVTGDAMDQVSDGTCRVDFRVEHRKVFDSRRGASSHCDDIHRFSGMRNVCYVRGFGDRFYESSFRFRGQGRSDSFGNTFGNIYRFLGNSKFLRQGFDIRFHNVRNSGRCY